MMLHAEFWIFAFAIILTIHSALWVFQIADGMLYENGTCTNENVTKIYNQVINVNDTVDDFLRSLPSDNTVLAELVCDNPAGPTITK